MRLRGVKRWLVLLLTVAVPLAAGETVSISQRTPLSSALSFPRKRESKILDPGLAISGIASWYSQRDRGIHRRTANGEIFNDQQMTCASWHYEFGTRLLVTNLQNGKSIVCRVNDRGPHKRLGRLMDLSLGAFRRIASPRLGLIRVSVRPVR